MKYIRTKEHGIGEITHEDKYIISYENSSFSVCLWKDNVEYQTADTIEELCDEFVIVGTNWQQIIDLEDAKYNCDKHDNLKIYGAIWTDKGLIFVAIMNDKGEMKLI